MKLMSVVETAKPEANGRGGMYGRAKKTVADEMNGARIWAARERKPRAKRRKRQEGRGEDCQGSSILLRA